MTRTEFVAAVLSNAATVTHYESGGSGPGGCDCIGLIIGAFRLLGIRWPGTHGTNWTARYYVDGLSTYGGTGELQIGDVVFKAREPGEPGYSLPDTYRDSPDKRDYYHVGVVTDTAPFAITHCTTTDGGIKKDTAKGNWKYKATLEPIEEGGQPTMKKALVIAESGHTVNLREQPSKASRVLVQVPVGTEVDLIEENDDWDKVSYQGKTGYMMADFLIPVADTEPAPPDDEPPADGFVDIRLPEDVAFALLEALEGVLGHG